MQMPAATLGSLADLQVGWILSKSWPVRMISMNWSSVWPPSARPVLSGVKLKSRFEFLMPRRGCKFAPVQAAN